MISACLVINSSMTSAFFSWWNQSTSVNWVAERLFLPVPQ